MKFVKTKIAGLFIIEFFHAEDERGGFVKTYHKDSLSAEGLESNFEESFYSINNKGVIRGMHFQTPPHDHAKIVYCNHGSLTDVIVDIRKNSPTYGEFVTVNLTSKNHQGVYIPTGMAHGFESLEDHTLMTYLTSTQHAPAHDRGIHFQSFGHSWKSANPIINKRDNEWPELKNFISPF